MTFAAFALALALPFAATAAFAESHVEMEGMDHSGMDGAAMMMPVPDGASDATRAYVEAMNAMMMATPEFSGDADVDYARGMIPHHQAAVDNSRTVLEYGSDPELRAFAERVIATQEEEIAFLQKWLADKGM